MVSSLSYFLLIYYALLCPKAASPVNSCILNITILIAIIGASIIHRVAIEGYCHYNQFMKVCQLHSWQISTAEAMQIQRDLAVQVSHEYKLSDPHFIAGADISVSRDGATARAAVVILEYPELKIIEVATSEAKLNFPYVPGLLSFREAPLVLDACQKLSINPDLLLIDGQGIAHPRRLGLASHLGLFLDKPTIGCAKSRLCGWHEPLSAEAGAYTELIDNNEVIGAIVRTKDRVKPVYVSVGHAIDLPMAIYWTKECCRGYRLPEPSRLAHIAAGRQSTAGKLAIHGNRAIPQRKNKIAGV